MGTAETFCGQCVEEMVKSTTENAEPQECQQGEKKMGLHGFYQGCVFRGNEMAYCAVLKEMNLTGLKTLSHIALNCKLNELEKLEQR